MERSEKEKQDGEEETVRQGIRQWYELTAAVVKSA
jgi:hypothetical protein